MDMQSYEALLDWSTKAGLTLHENIRREQVDGIFGMYATGSIRKGEIFASFPKAKLISMESGGPYPAKADQPFKVVASAANEYAKGKDSDHLGCFLAFETLDELKESSCYFYTPKEMEILAELSPSLHRVVKDAVFGAQARTKDICDLYPAIGEEIVLESMLNYYSRAFGPLGFLPVLDLFNHRDKIGSELVDMPGGKKVGFISKVDYDAGDQVWICYGKKDMFDHAIFYNYFDASGTHYINYGSRFVLEAKTAFERKVLELAAQKFQIVKIASGLVDKYLVAEKGLLILEKKPSKKLVEFLKVIAIETPQELSKGQCSKSSLKKKLAAIYAELEANNRVADLPLTKLPTKLYRFHQMLSKERQMVKDNKLWLEDN